MITVTAPPISRTGSVGTLHALLDRRESDLPETIAFRFLTDGEHHEEIHTYSTLAANARRIAAAIIRRNLQGQPILVIHPPGLGFIEALFACWYAGAIAVPAYPPRGSRHRKRFEAILADSAAKHVLAPADQPDIPRVSIFRSEDAPNTSIDFEPPSDIHAPCLIQYTSGSTSSPKGVVLTQHHFISHCEGIQPVVKHLDIGSIVSWLPPYHDMGLVLKILFAFERGIPLTFFSPDHFIQKPIRWLQAITRYGGNFSGAPNFAFEMCLRSVRDEDLSGLDLPRGKPPRAELKESVRTRCDVSPSASPHVDSAPPHFFRAMAWRNPPLP